MKDFLQALGALVAILTVYILIALFFIWLVSGVVGYWVMYAIGFVLVGMYVVGAAFR